MTTTQKLKPLFQHLHLYFLFRSHSSTIFLYFYSRYIDNESYTFFPAEPPNAPTLTVFRTSGDIVVNRSFRPIHPASTSLTTVTYSSRNPATKGRDAIRESDPWDCWIDCPHYVCVFSETRGLHEAPRTYPQMNQQRNISSLSPTARGLEQ